MSKSEYQTKYSEVKKQLHTCPFAYGSPEYKALKDLMNFYYRRGFLD